MKMITLHTNTKIPNGTWLIGKGRNGSILDISYEQAWCLAGKMHKVQEKKNRMVIPKHKEDNERSETDEWKAPSYGAVEGQSLRMFIEHFHSPH